MRYRHQMLFISKRGPSPEGIVDSTGRHVPMDEIVEMLNELAEIKEKKDTLAKKAELVKSYLTTISIKNGELWNAVNSYTEACGGDTSNATVSIRRMNAVVAVELTLVELIAAAIDMLDANNQEISDEKSTN